MPLKTQLPFICHCFKFLDQVVPLLHKWLVVPVADPLFVPVLEPGQGFRDKSLEVFVPGA